MSTRRTDYGVTYEIFAGTKKAIEGTVPDPETGLARDLTNTSVYSTVVFKVYKPNGELIGEVTADYEDRANGKVDAVIDVDIASNENAGNWICEFELLNIEGEVIDQLRSNFNIIATDV